MAKWLVKSEPSSWSFDQQIAAGEKGTTWNGVRNHTAKQYLMAMKLGDEAFFYHSNEGKEIVGIVEVSRIYYPDPTDASGKFGMVDFKVVKPLPDPVSLEAIKNEKTLRDMMLVKNSRLSVQPVTDAEWRRVCSMGGLSPAKARAGRSKGE
jgi:predicted RNA-binding protein with PUA-like domain